MGIGTIAKSVRCIEYTQPILAADSKTPRLTPSVSSGGIVLRCTPPHLYGASKLLRGYFMRRLPKPAQVLLPLVRGLAAVRIGSHAI